MALEDHKPEEPFYNEYFTASEFGFDSLDAAHAAMHNWFKENESLANEFVLYCRVFRQDDERELYGWEVSSEESDIEDTDVVSTVRKPE